MAFLVQYLPWFAVERTSFLFYMAPVTPFMVLAGVYAVRDIADVGFDGRRSAVTVGIASFLIATSIAMFVWFYPVLTGGTPRINLGRTPVGDHCKHAGGRAGRVREPCCRSTERHTVPRRSKGARQSCPDRGSGTW